MNIYMTVDFSKSEFENSFNQSIELIDLNDLEKSIKKADLIIFPGGSDVYPPIYGRDVLPGLDDSYNIQRDRLENKIFALGRLFKKKIFGVCRGHQAINVFRGGTLFQDLGIELNENHPYMHSITHHGDSIFSSFKIVNSTHHQGIDYYPGDTLEVVSTYGRIIEAIETEEIISCQWHPEFLYCPDFFDRVRLWAEKKPTKKEKNRPTNPYWPER